MANYYAKTLSNRVKVKDVNEFERIINSIESQEDIVVEKNVEKSTVLFYSNGCISIEDDNIATIEAIQNQLEDNEVLVIKEIGWEKFAYLYSNAYMISNEYVDHIDFDDIIRDHIEQGPHTVITFDK